MSEHIANLIKGLRKKEKVFMSQEEFASKIGVSASHVGMLEQGRSNPSYELIERLIGMFNDLEPNDFFKGYKRDAKSISAELVQQVEQMSPVVKDVLRLYVKHMNQIKNEVRDSSESRDQ